MAVGALNLEHALREPRRLDIRALASLFLTAVAIGGAAIVFSTAANTRDVLVVAQDMPAGATLHATDLRIAHVQVSDAMYQAAVPADMLNTLSGKQLSEPVHSQQMLLRAQLSTRPPLAAGQLAMTIPVTPASAVGGQVQRGDHVQVLATVNKGKPDAHTSVVLPDVQVYDVDHEHPLAVTGETASNTASGAVSSVTLVVTPDQAQQLALARWSSDLDVALLPPPDGQGR
jgi:Flp pilus assembly protein CpaB